MKNGILFLAGVFCQNLYREKENYIQTHYEIAGTEGFGLGDKENYPCQLQRALGDRYKVFNAGVTAHCVSNELFNDGRVMGLPYVRTDQYARGLAEKGDIYVLLLGTNDAQDGMLDDGSAIDPWGNIFSMNEFLWISEEQIRMQKSILAVRLQFLNVSGQNISSDISM